MSCSKGKNQSAIPTLSELCQERILRILERNKFNPRCVARRAASVAHFTSNLQTALLG